MEGRCKAGLGQEIPLSSTDVSFLRWYGVGRLARKVQEMG